MCTSHDCVAINGHCPSKVVGVSSYKAGLLRPCRSASHKHIDRANIESTTNICLWSPDHYRVTADRHRAPELFARRAVQSSQLRLIGPRCSGAHEHIGRTCVYTAGIVVVTGTHYCRVAADGRRDAEQV